VFDFVLTSRRLHKFAKATIGFVLFVCPSVRSSAWNNLAPIGQNF